MRKKLIAGLALLGLMLAGCQQISPPDTTPVTTAPPTTYPSQIFAGYLTELSVNFGGYFVTTVAVTYDEQSLTQTYTVDGTTYQNTYDFSGRLLRQRIDGNGFWSEEVITYSKGVHAPNTEVYSREGFSRTIFRTFDPQGNTLTTHTEATDGSWNTYTYTYDEEGKALTEKYVSSGGSDTLSTNTYDEQGRLVHEVTLNKGEKTREVTHKYDEKGRIIQDYVWRWEKAKDLITASTTDFTYDAYGNLATQHQVDLDGYWNKIESTYTPDGKLLTDNHINSYGDTYAVTHTYDEKGNLTLTEEGYNGVFYRYAYEYDAAGRVLTRTVTDPEGNTTETVRYTYDAFGNTLEVLTAYADGSSEKDVRTYDQYGNLLTYCLYYNENLSSCTYTYGTALIAPQQQSYLRALMEQAFVEFLP